MSDCEEETPGYLQLCTLRFRLTLPEFENNKDIINQIKDGIVQWNMAPYYESLCEELHWPVDTVLLAKMKEENSKKFEELKKLANQTVDPDESTGSVVWRAELDYLCSIGDRKAAEALATEKYNDQTLDKTKRTDAAFTLFRIAYFHGCDIKAMGKAIEQAKDLIVKGAGDWSARNKLKAYEALYCLGVRNFEKAAKLFIEAVPTFESYELLDFSSLVRYTVVACTIALDRNQLEAQMRKGVMAQALNAPQEKPFKLFYESFYQCQYRDFFQHLARMETDMKMNPLLNPHYRYYVREMRLRAYAQLLQAYRSLSLQVMASEFGVSVEFIENEVARFATAGRLAVKIDRVAMRGCPAVAQQRAHLYQTIVKRGDVLLNQLKKIARVIDY
ncbi:26S proteasome non-ATPase regulatory subunit, putative [Pediculus humanus corporis]|uniref:26S proteasome non-ATPase regulatory subunit 6 n=1 Tax=Pediculus humanus subsp. corporis TaxID=121224 RepID=E0VCN5_PEDHC|nr:26S proteasome non-ATPase regulatory subunit, putative [Pediculus humanus corporis]EEB11141.1 26S proteasome non-ATPase regulatory subunit, putative [Pediculus humanus corporis]